MVTRSPPTPTPAPAWLEGWALKGTKGEATAYKHYGDTEFRQGRYVGAITQDVRALEIRNDEPGIWLNLGIAYLRTNQPPLAERALQTVLTVNPTDQMRHTRTSIWPRPTRNKAAGPGP